MNALVTIPSPSEMVNARQLLETTADIIASASRELLRCNPDTDPSGDRGAMLESRILRAQAIVGHQVKVLTGMSVDDLAKAMGL